MSEENNGQLYTLPLFIHWILADIDQGLGYPGLGLYMMFEPHLISLDKLKMGANAEFALQVILIWVVFRTMHQFVPGICKV